MRRVGISWLVAVILLAVATSLWAADGWYLLIPRLSEYNESADFLNGFKVLDSKALSEWGQQGAYDSAMECETVRHDLSMVEQRIYSSASDAYLKAVGEGTEPALLKHQRWFAELQNAKVLALMAGRCVRSGDPQLRQ
jgi:hypothetical protein